MSSSSNVGVYTMWMFLKLDLVIESIDQKMTESITDYPIIVHLLSALECWRFNNNFIQWLAVDKIIKIKENNAATLAIASQGNKRMNYLSMSSPDRLLINYLDNFYIIVEWHTFIFCFPWEQIKLHGYYEHRQSEF